MDLFTKLLGDLLIFVYHCFDQWCGKPVVFIEQPGISGLGREQDKLTDRDDSSVASGGAASNVAYLIDAVVPLPLDA
jgi:hypothetical protein